jgi:hypothetical protein
MELVRMMESIAQDQIRDPTGKLGHGFYQDYVSDSEATVLRFTFAN